MHLNIYLFGHLMFIDYRTVYLKLVPGLYCIIVVLFNFYNTWYWYFSQGNYVLLYMTMEFLVKLWPSKKCILSLKVLYLTPKCISIIYDSKSISIISNKGKGTVTIEYTFFSQKFDQKWMPYLLVWFWTNLPPFPRPSNHIYTPCHDFCRVSNSTLVI